MIHSKNLKCGFSFIEIMMALALLGIFGSSLFLVQSNMFSKVFKTHQALFFSQDLIYDLVQLKNKVHQAVLQKQSVDTVTMQENKKNPDRKVTLKLIKISDQSELKDFAKNVRIVESSCIYDNNRTIQSFNFLYIPEAVEQKEKEEKNSSQLKTV